MFVLFPIIQDQHQSLDFKERIFLILLNVLPPKFLGFWQFFQISSFISLGGTVCLQYLGFGTQARKFNQTLLYSLIFLILTLEKIIITLMYKKQIKMAKAQRKNPISYNYEYQYDSKRNRQRETREQRQLRQLRQLQSASQQNLQDQSYYVDKKALRWWQRIEEKYFKQIDKSDIFIFRDLIFKKFEGDQAISDSQEDFKNEKMSINSYSHQSNENNSAFYIPFLESQIQCGNVYMKVPSIIRVLFKNNDSKLDNFGQENIGSKNQILALFALQQKVNNKEAELFEPMIIQDDNLKTEKIGQFKAQYVGSKKNVQNIQQKLNLITEQCSLSLLDYEDNNAFIQKCKKVQQESKKPYLYGIDKEIALWQWQLQNQYHENISNMNQLQQNIQKIENQEKQKKIICSKQALEKQVEQINYSLTWSTVLRCFEEGHKDKTWELFYSYRQNEKQSLRLPANKARMRAVAKNRQQKNITTKERQREKYKFLETDCKICFCSVNPDYNQVLYCDDCNTSFHRACYGLKCIPPQQNYYCDTCKYKRKQRSSRNTSSYFAVEDKKQEIRIYCQICQKQNFPMKNIDNHFYHITCLILCNFIQFKNGKFLLTDGLTHQDIQNMVVDNQINHDSCQFCINKRNCNVGMQLNCSGPNCTVSFHPICAYLSGCAFQIKKQKIKGNYQLKVSIFCNNHNQDRKPLQQIYLRQYMCNLNCLSGKDKQQFYEILKKEEQKKIIAKSKNKQIQTETIRILEITNKVKKYRMEREQAQKRNKFGQIKTETSQMLDQIKKKPKKF